MVQLEVEIQQSQWKDEVSTIGYQSKPRLIYIKILIKGQNMLFQSAILPVDQQMLL